MTTRHSGHKPRSRRVDPAVVAAEQRLVDEVQHWKSKYIDMAGRYDSLKYKIAVLLTKHGEGE